MKAFILLATLTGFAMFAAQSTESPKVEVKKVSAPRTKASSGAQMFKEYCSACHGLNGMGDGPATPALKMPPSDLTQLKAKNDGKFPHEKVSQILRGNDVVAHGSSDMPTWGPIFHQLDNGDRSIDEIRVHNLAKYLESIQK